MESRLVVTNCKSPRLREGFCLEPMTMIGQHSGDRSASGRPRTGNWPSNPPRRIGIDLKL